MVQKDYQLRKKKVTVNITSADNAIDAADTIIDKLVIDNLITVDLTITSKPPVIIPPPPPPPSGDPGLPVQDGWFEQLDKNANKDPTTWKVVPMTKDPMLSKVVDNAGINRAVEFKTAAGAQQYIAHFLWLKNNNNPPPPPPPPIDHGCTATQYWDEATQMCKEIPITPPPPVGEGIDADGVPFMSTPKPNGRNWYLKPESLGTLPPIDSDNRINPSGDTRLSLEVQTAAIMTLGSRKYVHTTSTTSNERCSIHIGSHTRDDDKESNIKYAWNSGAQEHHYMVWPDDIMSAEYTLIFKITGIMDLQNEISGIFGGAGHHTAPATNNQASCYNNHFRYSGSDGKKAFSVEFNHGTYERVDAVPMTTYGSMEGKVFGVKICSMPRADFSARDVVTFINEDPIDLATGKPKKTGWKKYTMRTQTDYLGKKNPHVWGGAKDKWRCDHIKQMDFYYASQVEIVAMPK